MYQLKKGQEAFTVVEGLLAGRSFAPGRVYDEIPPGTAGKFTEIKKAAPAKAMNGDMMPHRVPVGGKTDNRKAAQASGDATPHRVPADKEVKS